LRGRRVDDGVRAEAPEVVGLGRARGHGHHARADELADLVGDGV
jgi:hypothetical protein